MVGILIAARSVMSLFKGKKFRMENSFSKGFSRKCDCHGRSLNLFNMLPHSTGNWGSRNGRQRMRIRQ